MFPRTAIASITGIGGMAGGVGSMILQKVADVYKRQLVSYLQSTDCSVADTVADTVADVYLQHLI